MSDLIVPTTVSNFQERWVIVCVNPSNSDDKMEFASVVELNAELFRLKAEVERLKEGNDCLGHMHDKEMERSAYLREEFNRTTAWGRGLESDLSHARVEISFLKAEVERLDTLCKQLMNQHSDISCENIMLRKAGDELLDGWIGMYGDHKGSMAQDYIKLWNAAKEGKPTK